MTVDPGKAPREGTPYGLFEQSYEGYVRFMETWLPECPVHRPESLDVCQAIWFVDEKKPPRRAATAEEEGRHQTPRPPDPTGSA